ncbi:MAG: GAF domain-containing protein [Phycisphaerales bacterium]|nr:GAF domain-containing protein [Planctomycetota bacterium]MCH8509167.1 GAF domain-containing protein [Phycisphaerales bacterium]
MPTHEREYEPIFLALNHVAGDRQRRMREAADTLWRFLKDHAVSWVGFYTKADDADEMILGPARDKPACSPIGLHGACGQALLKKRPLIVNDVRNLGMNYVACDPRDLAELVIPLFDETGRCYGVLDLDSFERSAFSEHDLINLRRLMESTGISWPAPHLPPLVY